jgi:hypothetical protein
MIDDHTGIQDQDRPPDKLILPAPLDTPVNAPQRTPTSSLPGTPAYLEQHLHHAAPQQPGYPFKRFAYHIRTDPAYPFLIAALAIVLILGGIGASFAGDIFAKFAASSASARPAPPQNPPQATPVGTIDLRPTFPTPGGGQGSTTSSLPPASAPVTVTPQTTTVPDNNNGTLNLQITGIPQQVSNNSTIPVSITAGEPGVIVRLMVVYSAPPNFYSSGTQITDADGNATLNWHVRVFAGSNFGFVTAEVTVVGQDQNGQQATSSPVTVEITGKGIVP